MVYFVLTFILSCLSPLILLYISIATTLGPWIAPTFAIALMFFLKKQRATLLFPLAASSLGGIIATAFGFSFPTLFFLEPDTFIAWLHNPLSFIVSLACLSLAASVLGLLVALKLRSSLIEQEKLSFPVGQLMYAIVDAPQTNQQRQLISGFATSFLCGLMTIKIWWGKSCISESITLFNKKLWGPFLLPPFRLSLGMTPMLLAIGFIAGSMVTLPLFVGVFSNILFLHPLHMHWFPTLSASDFLFAFCSGIVLSGVFEGMVSIPQQMYEFVFKKKTEKITVSFHLMAPLLLSVLFFSIFKFSFLSQVYVIALSILCAYQISYIAGKIGLALLGRFATFVMVPGMFLFGFDALQLTILATFVEIVGGVAADALFSYKAAHLAGLDYKKMVRFQYIGIIISSVALAIFFWFFCNHFQLGTEQFFAQRAQGRALLIQAASFDYYVVAIGTLFGISLKRVKISPLLVFGGLLMPLSLSIPLIAGGLISSVIKNKQDYEPFCSGVFAANAFTMFLGAFF